MLVTWQVDMADAGVLDCIESTYSAKRSRKS